MPDNPGPPDIYEKTPDFFQPIQLDLHATDSAMGREETDQSAVCGHDPSSKPTYSDVSVDKLSGQI
jgi:hypothetical protein